MARAPRIVRVGSAWHLGVLLIGADAVYATGEIVRARAEAPRGFTAESQRARAELAAAARRGGFAEGEAVHVGWRMLHPDALAEGEASGPLALRDGVPERAVERLRRLDAAAALPRRAHRAAARAAARGVTARMSTPV